jgi:hypothetical protein
MKYNSKTVQIKYINWYIDNNLQDSLTDYKDERSYLACCRTAIKYGVNDNNLELYNSFLNRAKKNKDYLLHENFIPLSKTIKAIKENDFAKLQIIANKAYNLVNLNTEYIENNEEKDAISAYQYSLGLIHCAILLGFNRNLLVETKSGLSDFLEYTIDQNLITDKKVIKSMGKLLDQIESITPPQYNPI